MQQSFEALRSRLSRRLLRPQAALIWTRQHGLSENDLLVAVLRNSDENYGRRGAACHSITGNEGGLTPSSSDPPRVTTNLISSCVLNSSSIASQEVSPFVPMILSPG